MIREFRKNDLNILMQIWLDTNMQAHNFIPKEYWTDHYDMVKEMLPQSELYVYENDDTNQIEGFVGLTDDYVAGIFVRKNVQSKGIGKQLLDYVKAIKSGLRLNVYQKNTRAVCFYQREHFVVQSEHTDDTTNEKEFLMTWKSASFLNNIYDNKEFYDAYAQMARSKEGLKSAGEWHQLQALIPPLEGKVVLDLGCGYGWHSKYAADQGALSVLGLDLSERMIREAKKRNAADAIVYRVCGVEEYEYPKDCYDFVISNLALHYIADLDFVFQKVFQTLKPGGIFLFNMEHPVFTAGVNEDWLYGEDGMPAAWPIDNYFYPGERKTLFLGQSVIKQHHTLTQILLGVIHAGFILEHMEEAQPPKEMMHISGMKDEMRRPMMLLVRAKKG